MTLNYMVHGVMYGFFALNDAFDDAHFRQRWAGRITFLQCSQFVLDLMILAVGTYDHTYNKESVISTPSLVISTFVLSSYLVLFLHFAEQKYGMAIAAKLLRMTNTANAIRQGAKSMPWHDLKLTLDQRFSIATKNAVMLSHVASPFDIAILYGAYKVAKYGRIPESSTEPVEQRSQMKHRAWTAASAITQDQAKARYIDLMDKLAKRSRDQALKDTRKNTHKGLTRNNDSINNDPSVLYPVRIAGHGKCVPKAVIDNDEIARRGQMPRSGERELLTGVRERRFASVDDGENLVESGAQAIRIACKSAGISIHDIDLIVAGMGGHQGLPDDACLIQRELGLGESGTRAFTVHATCLSFFVAMDVAGSFMRDGRYKCVALVASTVCSVGHDFTEPHTAGFFGDGAAALILKSSTTESVVHSVHMETYGCGADACKVEGCGTFRSRFSPFHDPKMDPFRMDPTFTLSIIAKYLPGVLMRALPGLEMGLEGVQFPGCTDLIDIDWVVPHQASAKGLDALSLFGWDDSKVLKTLHKYGNTVSASIPITLCENLENGKIKRGDKVPICGTSAGISLGAMLLTY